jgi:hypothetical protein
MNGFSHRIPAHAIGPATKSEHLFKADVIEVCGCVLIEEPLQLRAARSNLVAMPARLTDWRIGAGVWETYMNALRRAFCMFFSAIDAAAWSVSLLCVLNLLGQLVIRIPLRFVVNLVPKGVESSLLQNMLAGFEVVLIGAPLIVAAMLSRELHLDEEK